MKRENRMEQIFGRVKGRVVWCSVIAYKHWKLEDRTLERDQLE